MDIRSYFPSIDAETLLGLVRRAIRDGRFVRIIEQILYSTKGLYDEPEIRRSAQLSPDWPPPGRGLPIGSHLSQFFAGHLYLNDLDHFAKRHLKVPEYVRYVDDLFLFGDHRTTLADWRQSVADWVYEHRNLLLKHPHAPVISCRGTLDALGYRLTRSGLQARPRAFKRLRKRILREITKDATRPDWDLSLSAHAGVLMF